jgi:glyoxylate/hydroxypyruvate reductase
MAKVLVTRILPPQTQARLLQQGLELTQWDKDCAMPRDQLLEKVQGKSISCRNNQTKKLTLFLGVDGLLCLLTDKIDDELLDAAGRKKKTRIEKQ